MKIHLLGTGAADGLPSPFCRCDTCAAERSAGRVRTNSCAIIDDAVLIDCGPTATSQAARAGVDLAGISHVLITHGHPDHLAPQFLLWRQWIPGLGPVHVWGPPLAIDTCRDWVGPNDPVTFHVVQPDDRLTLDDRWQVHVLPAAHGTADALATEAVLYDICDASGHRILYATDTGPLPASTIAMLDAEPRDAVFLEETFGTNVDHGTGHHDLPAFEHTITTLREHSLLAPDARVVAIHLGHHNPPAPRLCEHLAAIGAEALEDLAIVHTRMPRPAHRHLILGGARSGKSRFAEELASSHAEVTYVATGYPEISDDADWTARIAAHQMRRPPHWRTTETIDLTSVIATAKTCLLIDCLGLWVTRTIDAMDGWDSPTILADLQPRIAELAEAIGSSPVPIIVVSNDVGGALTPTTRAGRVFQDALGVTNAQVANRCTDVTMMVAGVPMEVRRAP